MQTNVPVWEQKDQKALFNFVYRYVCMSVDVIEMDTLPEEC